MPKSRFKPSIMPRYPIMKYHGKRLVRVPNDALSDKGPHTVLTLKTYVILTKIESRAGLYTYWEWEPYSSDD